MVDPTKPEDTSRRYVVLWSGGMDSTALLHHYAGVSSEDYPVTALTITKHPQLNKHFIKAQNAAQKRYLKFAKQKGYHIKHERMGYSGTFRYNGPHSGRSQPTVWLASLIQTLDDKDIVLMGYMRTGCFWHYRGYFVNAFNAMQKLKGVDAKLEFPFEWDNKAEIYARLHADKVPNNCWFSCEETKTSKACGTCDKCVSIKKAIHEVLNPPQITIKRKRKKKKH